MSAQCQHGLIRDECWKCRNKAKQETHVAHVFAGGLVTAVQQLEERDAEIARLRADLAAVRADLNTAHSLLLEARNLFDPYGDGRLNDSLSQCCDVCARIDAALAGQRREE